MSGRICFNLAWNPGNIRTLHRNSYQHYDSPDADYDATRGHLWPAEQQRRHVGKLGRKESFFSEFIWLNQETFHRRTTGKSADPHHSGFLGENRKAHLVGLWEFSIMTPPLPVTWPIACKLLSPAVFPLSRSPLLNDIEIFFLNMYLILI